MSEKNESRMGRPGQFCWNELMTTDVAAAKTFYTRLLGWTAGERVKEELGRRRIAPW